MEDKRERGPRQGPIPSPVPCLNIAGSGPFRANGRIMFDGGVTHLSGITWQNKAKENKRN